MPDKNNEGGDQSLGEIKSRSAQSGPPDDKERDSTQSGDQSGQADGQVEPRGQKRSEKDDGENG